MGDFRKFMTNEDIESILKAAKDVSRAGACPDVMIFPEPDACKLCKDAGLTQEETDLFIEEHAIQFGDDND